MQTVSKAPWGLAVKVITISVGIVVALSYYMLAQMPLGLPLYVEALVRYSPLVLFAYLWMQRVRLYEIKGTTLVIRRLVGSKEVELAQITKIEKPLILVSKLKKHFGNSGVFHFSGTFSYPKIGKFKAYVTDWQNAVFITTPQGIFAISPKEESVFIEALANIKEGIRTNDR